MNTLMLATELKVIVQRDSEYIIGGSNSITCGCDLIKIARCWCVDASWLSVNKITYQLCNMTKLGSEYSLLKFFMQSVYAN
jgi:hypothetical protein